MTYKFDSIVTKHEADALKEMIFNRARERSKDMTQEVQADVMDFARDSFVSKDNPFSKIIESAKPENRDTITKVESAATNIPDETDGIGFPKKTTANTRLSTQSRLINEQITSAAVANTMQEARAGLSNKQSFMGALNFLNSQAAISLIRTRADKFEVLA